jgi:uncharacterized phage-associated protein
MTLSAHDVAAVLRERLPGIGKKKLHKTLYYCQGHHLAAFGVPLFRETISAWDMGPVVGQLWHEENSGDTPAGAVKMTEGQLNIIGYVASRYGKMTGRELEILTHGESPWQRADESRIPGTSARIELEWIREHFVAAEIADREDEPVFGTDDVSRFIADARERLTRPAGADDPDRLRAKYADLAARD